MKILLLDDDPFALNLLNIQLRTFGLARRGYVDVVCCDSGAAALAQLAEDPRIALVFCDLQMPEMDGVEFVRHLVASNYAGGLVLISGENPRVLEAAERLARAHALRVLGALQKPVQSASLLALLELAMPPRGRPAAPSPPPAYPPEEVAAAIEAGQIINHYQPKVALATGEVIGVEALARWMHPRDGLVAPYRFIPVAEEHGLIDALGARVLRNAVRDAAAWRQAGHPLQVAVNVSMASLASIDFPDQVVTLAHEAGVPACDVVLEVTESRLMDQPTAQLDVLTRLRLKRVCLSIDDFGTGYSCLSQLRDLPFEELKIDRGFVHGVAGDPSLRAIVDSVLGLVRQLGVRVVAEGIEEQADWDLLRAAGCDMGQGYFIARPMPAEQLLPWMDTWKERWLVAVG